MPRKKIRYADDDVTPLTKLLVMRLPILFVGLILGVLLSLSTARFEGVLSKNIELAFFIPFIVYIADAIGTQTEAIYTRDLRTGRTNFKKYLLTEAMLGVIFGGLASLVTAGVTMLWFASVRLTIAVSLAMLGSVATAPVVAVLVTEFLHLEHTDPAVGSGPIATAGSRRRLPGRSGPACLELGYYLALASFFACFLANFSFTVNLGLFWFDRFT